MRHLLAPLSICSIVLLTACGESTDTKTTTTTDASKTTTTTPAPPAAPSAQCFIETVNKDTTMVRLAFDGNKVSGRFYWKPFEVDGALGSLSGTRQGDTLVVVYDYVIEGSQQKEEKIMVLRNGNLQIFSGELDERNGMMVIKDRSTMTVSQELHTTDCSSITIPE